MTDPTTDDPGGSDPGEDFQRLSSLLVAYERILQITQDTVDVLTRVRNGEFELSGEVTAKLLEALQSLRDAVDNLSTDE
jgi:hypothetical protein